MKTIKNLEDKYKGRSGLILCAGANINKHHNDISTFIRKTDPIMIGINNISETRKPYYHLWTNTQRFRTFGKNIHPSSKILLGSNISRHVIQDIIGKKPYTLINYTDAYGNEYKYKNGKITGYYRTAGCLAIMMLHIMGIKDINIVGMDGYSLHSKEDLDSGKQSHHCYGKGYTDTANWETCIKKDEIINNVLKNLKGYGIKFKILTPTKYEEFYDSTRLHI